MKILIRNVTLVTMKDEAPFMGDILIESDRIADIDSAIGERADETIEGAGMVAMPGLINAHQHTPMSLLRAFSDDLPLMDWLRLKMYPAEARMTPEDIYWGAKLSMAEMIKSGTTAFADMYVHMNEVAAAVEEAGLRASLTRGLVFVEDDGGKRMAEALELIDRWTGKADGRITTMLGPHSPYMCPPEQFGEIIRLAEEKNIPIHTHLAETKEEIAAIRDKYNRTPTEYVQELGLFERAHALLAHGVHLSRQDVDLLKGMRGGISHNPASNLKLGCGIAPVSELIAHGVTVGLGTDGAGSAATVDMFAAVRAASWLQKLDSGDPGRLPASQALRMATRESAKLLNIDRQVGTLEVGSKADLILIDMRKPHLQPVHNVASVLAYCATGADVDTTIVNGRILMKGRQLLTMDEEELYAQAARRAKRIVEGI